MTLNTSPYLAALVLNLSMRKVEAVGATQLDRHAERSTGSAMEPTASGLGVAARKHSGNGGGVSGLSTEAAPEE